MAGSAHAFWGMRTRATAAAIECSISRLFFDRIGRISRLSAGATVYWSSAALARLSYSGSPPSGYDYGLLLYFNSVKDISEFSKLILGYITEAYDYNENHDTTVAFRGIISVKAITQTFNWSTITTAGIAALAKYTMLTIDLSKSCGSSGSVYPYNGIQISFGGSGLTTGYGSGLILNLDSVEAGTVQAIEIYLTPNADPNDYISSSVEPTKPISAYDAQVKYGNASLLSVETG